MVSSGDVEGCQSMKAMEGVGCRVTSASMEKGRGKRMKKCHERVKKEGEIYTIKYGTISNIVSTNTVLL